MNTGMSFLLSERHSTCLDSHSLADGVKIHVRELDALRRTNPAPVPVIVSPGCVVTTQVVVLVRRPAGVNQH